MFKLYLLFGDGSGGGGFRSEDITSFPLYKVFMFWLECLGKLLNFLKTIYIFPGISYFHVIIGFLILSIVVSLFRFGMRVVNDVRWFDGATTYYNPNNEYGVKNFGKPRRNSSDRIHKERVYRR